MAIYIYIKKLCQVTFNPKNEHNNIQPLVFNLKSNIIEQENYYCNISSLLSLSLNLPSEKKLFPCNFLIIFLLTY